MNFWRKLSASIVALGANVFERHFPPSPKTNSSSHSNLHSIHNVPLSHPCCETVFSVQHHGYATTTQEISRSQGTRQDLHPNFRLLQPAFHFYECGSRSLHEEVPRSLPESQSEARMFIQAHHFDTSDKGID